MSDSEKALARYVEKMYEIQYSQQDNILSDSELKKVALEMGISEEEWAESEKVFEGHLANGKEMILQQNYTDAAETLDHAVALKPYHTDALYFLAKAHVGVYESENIASSSQKAKDFIDRTLKVSPGHKQSLALLSQLRRGQSEGKKTKMYIVLGLVGVFALFSIIGFVSYNSARNQAIQQEESVNQAWAQVENVYQRRADLIPQLVTVVKQSAQFEESMIDKITKAHTALASSRIEQFNKGGMSDFNEKQEALTKAINKLFASAQEYPELETMEAYQNLQVQIEGSENRISVERRKFNKSVQAYNTYIRQFPQSIMGFDAKPYFEVDKKAMEKPNLD